MLERSLLISSSYYVWCKSIRLRPRKGFDVKGIQEDRYLVREKVLLNMLACLVHSRFHYVSTANGKMSSIINVYIIYIFCLCQQSFVTKQTHDMSENICNLTDLQTEIRNTSFVLDYLGALYYNTESLVTLFLRNDICI